MSMNESESRAVVLLSGGIDSAVCLQEALENHTDVMAVHYDYGQQTEHIERNNAERQAEKYDVNLEVVDYRDMFGEFAEGTIRDKEYDEDNLVEDDHSVGYVPQRNLHLLTSASAIAEHKTVTGKPLVLYTGPQEGDAEYPDCSPEFIEYAEHAINQSTEQHEITIETPLIDKTKKEVLEYGEELGVDWELTFSCYNDQDGEPCGGCPACVERQEAFEKVEFDDPVMEGVDF